MLERGVYRQNFRGLTLGECWRFGGPVGFPVALILKAIKFPGEHVWLPAEEAERPCAEAELPDDARIHLSAAADRLRRLGYAPGRFSRLVLNLDRNSRCAAGYLALHSDGRRVMHCAYIHYRNVKANVPIEMQVVAAFGSIFLEDSRVITVANNKNFMDGEPGRRFIPLYGADVEKVDARLAREMEAQVRPVRRFPDVDAAYEAGMASDRAAWESRIARGLFHKVPEDEALRVLDEFGLGEPDTGLFD